MEVGVRGIGVVFSCAVHGRSCGSKHVLRV